MSKHTFSGSVLCYDVDIHKHMLCATSLTCYHAGDSLANVAASSRSVDCPDTVALYIYSCTLTQHVDYVLAALTCYHPAVDRCCSYNN